MKLKKVISVLTVLSLLTSSIGISAFASNRIEPTENTDYTYTPTTEETITTEPTTEPETTDDMQQYEELKKNLMQEYENALSLNKEEYTEKSFENLENEINFTKTVLENWEELYTAGDFALKSLKEAVLNLESYKDLLLDVIEKAEKISSEWYTDESFKVLTDAIEKGREAIEKGGVTKDIANSLISDIQKAEENLYNIKDLLKQTIDEAKKKYDLVYEESSMAQFKTEIERIEKAFNDNLTSQEVKELIEAVKEARSHGDLSENFEYHAAKKEKNRNESRIRYLERMLKTAIIVEDHSKADEVGLNNTVEIYCEDDEEVETYRIVTSVRGSSLNGLVSIESPIGKALLGHKEGDRVYVKVNDDYGYYVVIRKVIKTASEDGDQIRSY